jgi:hypothetical protein
MSKAPESAEALLLREITRKIFDKPIETPEDMFIWMYALQLERELDAERVLEQALIKNLSQATEEDVRRRVPERTVVKSPQEQRVTAFNEGIFCGCSYRVRISKPDGTHKDATVTVTYNFRNDQYVLHAQYDGYQRDYNLKKSFGKGAIMYVDSDESRIFFDVEFDRQLHWKSIFGGHWRDRFRMELLTE